MPWLEIQEYIQEIRPVPRIQVYPGHSPGFPIRVDMKRFNMFECIPGLEIPGHHQLEQHHPSV